MDGPVNALVFFASSVLGIVGAAAKPVVTFSPNVNKIFQGENVTMTCNVESPIRKDGAYYWYRNGHWMTTRRIVTISLAEGIDQGNYHCWTKYTSGSDALSLEVSNGWVILQAPHQVHEGDNITLRCRHHPTYEARQTIFYKDQAVIQSWGPRDEVHIGYVDMEKAGKYECTKEVFSYGMYHLRRDEASIAVIELFLKPNLTITPDLVTRGDHMTLTCNTKLQWLRRSSELQFAFYKDERNVQGFGSSNQYGVQFAQLEDSGNYSCEVRTLRDSARKRSEKFSIIVKEPAFYLVIEASFGDLVEGDHMTLRCQVIPASQKQEMELTFAFHRDGRNVQEFSSSDQYGVQSAQLEDSGEYSCDVRTSDGKVRKSRHFIPIVVKELFSIPVINVSASEVLEGDTMTLTCDTRLNPLRPRRELQFAFYRNGQNVQKFSSSDQYGVQSAQVEDSGNYSCDVTTSDGKVRKSSHFIPIVIKDYTTMNVIRLVISIFILCLICGLIIHHVKTYEDQ